MTSSINANEARIIELGAQLKAKAGGNTGGANFLSSLSRSLPVKSTPVNADLNSNGTVDIVDAQIVARYIDARERGDSAAITALLQQYGLTESALKTMADTNTDGRVSLIDAINMARQSVGLVGNLTVQARDINGDGTVTILDALLADRYVAAKTSGNTTELQNIFSQTGLTESQFIALANTNADGTVTQADSDAIWNGIGTTQVNAQIKALTTEQVQAMSSVEIASLLTRGDDNTILDKLFIEQNVTEIFDYLCHLSDSDVASIITNSVILYANSKGILQSILGGSTSDIISFMKRIENYPISLNVLLTEIPKMSLAIPLPEAPEFQSLSPNLKVSFYEAEASYGLHLLENLSPD